MMDYLLLGTGFLLALLMTYFIMGSDPSVPAPQVPPAKPPPDPRQEKMQEVLSRGGMLAKELERTQRVSAVSDTALQVMYISATQKDIRFNLATERRVSPVEYPTGSMDYVQITDASQMQSITPEQMALDDDTFYQHLSSNELMRTEYYDVVETFKRLYILHDVSPSMFEGTMPGRRESRDVWARGVISSLLVDAVSGAAEYLYRAFATGTGELQSAMNMTEAEKLLDVIVNKPFNGRGTDISNAIKVAVQDIRSRQSNDSRMNHILLITDGEDSGVSRDALAKALGDDIHLHVVLIGLTWPPEHPLTPYVIMKY